MRVVAGHERLLCLVFRAMDTDICRDRTMIVASTLTRLQPAASADAVNPHHEEHRTVSELEHDPFP